MTGSGTVPALSVNDLTAGYGAMPVIHGIDLSVAEGEALVLIGPNGHGKTTLLRAITGLATVGSGRVELFGERIDGRSAEEIAARGVVHIPQGDHLFTNMSVEENLLMGAFRKEAWSKRHESMRRVFELFPRLEERRGQQVRTLSGGEQRQVAFGRGLMRDARMLVIDEPSLGLAPVLVEAVYDVIRQLLASGEITLLLAEENFQHIADVADRVCVIEMGRILRSGTVAEVADDPSIASAYLGGISS